MKSQRRGQSQESSKIHSARKEGSNRNENIKVYVRVKPEKVEEKCLTILSAEEICVASHKTMEERTFRFDEVFNQSVSTRIIYNKTCQPLLEQVIRRGTNACILVYGQTGSGKTHTMGMLREISELDQGIVSMALHQIFNDIEELTDQNTFFDVELSFIQIYMEELDDLLNPDSGNKLTLRRNEASDPYIRGQVNVRVQDFQEAIQIVNAGLRYRHTGQQNLNNNSSRSHTILTVYINRTTDQNTFQSKIQLVDLAGSERTKKTQSKGLRMEEAKHINQSLAALGNVVSALVNHNNKFVPFRDSKLTQVLECSLKGQAQVVLFCTVTGLGESSTETLSTLTFANRCKMIKLRPTQVTDQSRVSNVEQQYQEEMKRIITAFELRQKQQDQHIMQLEKMLTTQSRNTSPFKFDDKSDHTELTQYLIKLLRKINQHTAKQMLENKKYNEQINRSTMDYLVEQLQHHNLNQNAFDRAHNIMTVTKIIQNLDETYPTQVQISEEIAPQESTQLSVLISHVQRVSQSLLSHINQLSKVAKISEKLKQELVLQSFLQQQREIELENWMRTVGYLYRTLLEAQGAQPNSKQARSLSDKIHSMINQGDFYQEMDRIKSRILQFTSGSSHQLNETLETLRKHTNNMVFDQKFEDFSQRQSPISSVLERESSKKPMPSIQSTQGQFESSQNIQVTDLLRSRRQFQPNQSSNSFL